MKRVGFVTCVQLGMSCIEEIYRLGGELKVIFTMHGINQEGFILMILRLYMGYLLSKSGISMMGLLRGQEKSFS